MNEAISALAASNTTETLHPFDVLAAAAETVKQVAENPAIVSALAEQGKQIVDASEIDRIIADAKTEVGSAESEVAKVETEIKTETVAAEVKAEVTAQSELDKIEDAALNVVHDITQKARNVFVDAEQFAVKEVRKVWNITHGGGSIIRNPA